MKTLLEAIQQYPEQFISTLQARANTTPSEINKTAHLHLALMVKLGNWVTVQERICDCTYRRPLEGVIYCLDNYSEIDNKVWHHIVDLFEQEKLV